MMPELTLFQVAEHVGLSEKYFTNRFTQRDRRDFFQPSDSSYGSKAKELLRPLRLRREIGEMVGYRNAGAFHQNVQKEAGCTPAQYRKLVNIQNGRIKILRFVTFVQEFQR